MVKQKHTHATHLYLDTYTRAYVYISLLILGMRASEVTDALMEHMDLHMDVRGRKWVENIYGSFRSYPPDFM